MYFFLCCQELHLMKQTERILGWGWELCGIWFPQLRAAEASRGNAPANHPPLPPEEPQQLPNPSQQAISTFPTNWKAAEGLGWSCYQPQKALGVVCAVLTEGALSQFRTLCLDLINSMFLIKLKSGDFLDQLEQETIFGLLGNEFWK